METDRDRAVAVWEEMSEAGRLSAAHAIRAVLSAHTDKTISDLVGLARQAIQGSDKTFDLVRDRQLVGLILGEAAERLKGKA